MAEVDILIQGGKLVDGTGSPWRNGDLAVKDGLIVSMGGDTGNLDAKKVINAQGKYVSPGFVDAHTHSDLILLADEWMEYRIMQGITTEVVGQDGLAYAPVTPEHRQEWRRYLKGLNGEFLDRISWDWTTTAELIGQYEGKASNSVHLIPHGAVRVEVMGWEDRPASAEELTRMQDLVRVSLEQGAAGISTGLTYIPCSHATTEEMIKLCQPVGDAGGILSIHLRSYANQLLEAVEESVTMGRESGAGIHISHLRMADVSTWHLAPQVLEIIDRARGEGIDITYDFYPYTVGCAPLFCLIPAWAQAGGPDAIISRLADSKIRALIRDELHSWALNWSNYSLSNAPNPKYKEWEGQPLTETAAAHKMDVYQLIMDVLHDTDLDATIIASGGDEAANQIMMRHSAGMIGSDGVMVGDLPHPRGYGTYPKLLTEYVRDNPILQLEEAIHKMTAMPAARHNVTNRGVLFEGAAADVVVFSLEDMEDRATYRNARQLTKGVDTVLINGVCVVEDGNYLGSKAGKALRPLNQGIRKNHGV